MTVAQQEAIDRARAYIVPRGRVFFNILPNVFLTDLVSRIEHPETIDQRNAAVCGPAAFLRGLAVKDPVRYANFACKLYVLGSAKLGDLTIVASEKVKNAHIGHRHNISPADWVTLASLRLSRNWFYKNPDKLNETFLTGVTWPAALADWFSQMGYDSTNRANLYMTKGFTNWGRACVRFGNGEIVCLFINTNMIDQPTVKSKTPNHWVGLSNVISNDPPKFEIFTWGGLRTITFTAMNKNNFTMNYYGYVSATQS